MPTRLLIILENIHTGLQSAIIVLFARRKSDSAIGGNILSAAEDGSGRIIDGKSVVPEGDLCFGFGGDDRILGAAEGNGAKEIILDQDAAAGSGLIDPPDEEMMAHGLGPDLGAAGSCLALG